MSQEIKHMPIQNLNLWTENPRDPIEVESTDFEIITRALTESRNKWNLQKLVEEMGSFYDLSELPTVVEINKKYIVYDGNRRIAILKYLQNKSLYDSLDTTLFFKEEPFELKNLKEIPCNVCDINTALANVERKHTNSGDWGRLERDYFALKHLKKEKSPFVSLDEQTNIITDYEKLNQRFVKEEILSLKNLSEIGFEYDPKKGFVSNYDRKTSNKIIEGIIKIVEEDVVQTRGKYRRKLKKPLIDTFPDLKSVLQEFDPSKKITKLTYTKKKPKKKSSRRKTPTSKDNDILFGKTLVLKKGKVNDLYRAILHVYQKNQKDAKVLPIIGMSLRLVVEVAARIYFDKHDPNKAKKDQVYRDFLLVAKKEMKLKQENKNYLSLTIDWMDSKNNLEAVLAKYAHGNIPISKEGILKSSFVVGEILEHYYKK